MEWRELNRAVEEEEEEEMRESTAVSNNSNSIVFVTLSSAALDPSTPFQMILSIGARFK
jgi:hypothetical protein